MFANGDKVVTHWMATGTHNGPCMGMEPTGKSISIGGVSISLIFDGRLVESSNYWDRQGLVDQLGGGTMGK
jgi:predicted ester cyclase